MDPVDEVVLTIQEAYNVSILSYLLLHLYTYKLFTMHL